MANFTYTDSDKIVLDANGKFKVTLLEAVEPGDLLSWYVTDNACTVRMADASSSRRADCIAIEAGAIGAEITAALEAEMRTIDTIATGGVVTPVYFAGAADFLGKPIYLGEDGKPSSSVSGTFAQQIGVLVARNRIMVDMTDAKYFDAPVFTGEATFEGTVVIEDTITVTQTAKGTGDGLDINRIEVINTAASGERTRVLQVALTGQASTEMGGGECFRAEITLSAGMSIASGAGIIGHYGWIEIEDTVVIGASALITPFRSVIYAHDNDLSAIGGGGESALFYGQTWGINSGSIDHGVRIVAGGTTHIGDIFGAVGGEGAIIGSIFDFLGLYDEDTNVCLAQWPIRDTTAGGRPVRWWMGRAVTREAVFLEMNAREGEGYAVHGRGTLYFSVGGEIYMKIAQADHQADWEVINHAAADTG